MKQQETNIDKSLCYCFNSFKTKGNLTKHMKSKGHYKKCIELGIDPEKSIEEDATSTADDTETVSTSNINNNNRTNSTEDTESEESSDGEDGESSGKNTFCFHKKSHCEQRQ